MIAGNVVCFLFIITPVFLVINWLVIQQRSKLSPEVAGCISGDFLKIFEKMVVILKPYHFGNF